MERSPACASQHHVFCGVTRGMKGATTPCLANAHPPRNLGPCMDNQRIILWALLCLLVYFNYLTWQRDYAPAPAAVTQTHAPSAAPSSELPALPTDSAKPTQAPPAVTAEAPAPAASAVRVVTDVLDMSISSRGGELDGAALLRYPEHKDAPTIPVRLFDTSADKLFIARSGLRAADDLAAPTHQAIFTAEQTSYELKPGQDTLPVRLTWSSGGVTVVKTYTFKRGSYAIDITYEVQNASGSDWKAASYVQIVRKWEQVKRSMFNVETYAYRGPAIYNGKAVRKLNVEDEDDRHFDAAVSGGWMAAMQHHFVVAAIPVSDASYDYQLKVDPNNDFTLSYRGPVIEVPAGATGTFHERVFVGPKLQNQLSAAGPQLERTADYGKLTIIAEPLFWLLQKVHGFVGNWGLSIIIVTFLIKLAFYQLTATSGRSMAKMRNLSPRIKSIQERYKDDREQLGRAMMELYKREKINPLAGCLPILIQVPFFMGFYWVLLESVEMRQAPFMGWITDLSSRDPYFVLPAIMGVAMFAQFKLNPPAADPMQAKIMSFMPIVMTVMMAWFPSGLVLYWITNTTLQIAQQWRINQVVSADNKKATA